MALTIDSKTKDLMKDEKAVAVLEEFFPGISKESRLKMAYNMSFRTILGYMDNKPSKETIDQLTKRIATLGE
jgi:hypothetical protein